MNMKSVPFFVIASLLSASTLAIELDQTAPDFTLKSRNGDNLRLEELRGKVVLINFWATWCGPCRQEMPILDRIRQRYQGAGFEVLGVNVEGKDPKARKISQEMAVSFPILFDDSQLTSADYDLQGMPFSVLIDRAGQVRYIHTGYKPGDEKSYINHLKKLLRD
jgi:thiol-disulfide isomerase/thioredoxin